MAKGFNISDTTASNWLKGIRLKRSNGKDVPAPSTLATTINSNPILVVTMADLAGMVKLGAERGNCIAQLIQNAGNATLIQQSVDEALGIERERSEYLQAASRMKPESTPSLNEPSVADVLKELTPLIEVAKEYMATRKAISLHHPGLSGILDVMSQPTYQKALPSAEMITTGGYLKANNITLDRKAKHCFANEAAFTFRVLAQKEPSKIGRRNVYRTSDVSILATALKSTLSKFE